MTLGTASIRKPDAMRSAPLSNPIIVHDGSADKAACGRAPDESLHLPVPKDAALAAPADASVPAATKVRAMRGHQARPPQRKQFMTAGRAETHAHGRAS